MYQQIISKHPSLLYFFMLFLLHNSYSREISSDPFISIGSSIAYISDPNYFVTKDTSNIFVVLIIYKSDVLTLQDAVYYNSAYLLLTKQYKDIIFIRTYGSTIKPPTGGTIPEFDFTQYPVMYIIHDNAIAGFLPGLPTSQLQVVNFILNTIKAIP